MIIEVHIEADKAVGVNWRFNERKDQMDLVTHLQTNEALTQRFSEALCVVVSDFLAEAVGRIGSADKSH